MSGVPTKRKRLQDMSPNVQRVLKATNPMLLPPPSLRSQLFQGYPHGLPKAKLRRTALLTLGDSQSLDRFIPSRHNLTTGKLELTTEAPHPNALPRTHIQVQTLKIYQRHVAEACGLDMNSRVLLYQPLPPERRKPHLLFNFEQLLASRAPALAIKPAAAYRRAKKIPTAPERVLDAPGLIDDFYLNLLAWSLTNLLAIGLEDSVYVWNALTGLVGMLCELANKSMVTSLRWLDDGLYISVGKDDGLIEIWDVDTSAKLRTLQFGHATRIAAQLWLKHVLTLGLRVGTISHLDVRVASHLSAEHKVHRAEVCGIEYRPDGQQWALGGNDNLVAIWDARNSTSPAFQKTNHKAAVKALLWCPYQLLLLATGGGSLDKAIHFWNTTLGARVNTIETDLQILSLNWGYADGIGMEIVATHGFPTNNISLFQYPTLQKTGEIVRAHDSRLLAGCLSPDQLTLATVAGDENLKFWSLFDLAKRRAGARDEDKENKEEPIENYMAFR